MSRARSTYAPLSAAKGDEPHPRRTESAGRRAGIARRGHRDDERDARWGTCAAIPRGDPGGPSERGPADRLPGRRHERPAPRGRRRDSSIWRHGRHQVRVAEVRLQRARGPRRPHSFHRGLRPATGRVDARGEPPDSRRRARRSRGLVAHGRAMAFTLNRRRHRLHFGSANSHHPKICPGQRVFKMAMVVGSSSLRRKAALTGLCLLTAFSSLAWGGPGRFLGAAQGASNQFQGGLGTSAPTPDSRGGTVIATVPVGNGPWGVGFDSGNGYAYVANSGSNTTTVISGTSVVATVSVESFPLGVGYDSGNGYIYVANLYSTNVSVISGTTVVATIPVGNGPVGVAYDSRNGYVYVANEGSHSVTVISGTTVVATIPVGTLPSSVAYDSGNGYVYVANSYSNNVSVISGIAVIGTIPVGHDPRGVGYDSGHGYVYVTNWGSNTVSVIATLESPAPPSIFGLDPWVFYSTVGGIVGFVAIASTWFVLRKRKRRP